MSTTRQAILLTVLAASAVLLVLVGMLWPRVVAQREAERAFLGSRDGSPDSVAFVSRGIEYGMGEDQVDHIMSSATKALKHMPQHDPPWSGHVNIYQFQYGGTWENPVTGKAEPLIEEWFFVYFNPQGRAVRLYRCFPRGGDLWSRQELTIDLRPGGETGSGHGDAASSQGEKGTIKRDLAD